MTDTIFTTQEPTTDTPEPPATSRSLGMRFTCSAAGQQATGGRVWVPSTGLPDTALWQLWVEGGSSPVREVDLHTLPAPTPEDWMPVPAATAYLLDQSTPGDEHPYIVCLFMSSSATEHYVYSGGQTLPVGSGGTISADTCLFKNDGLATEPPDNDGFVGGIFFVDVDVSPAAQVVPVELAIEVDEAFDIGVTLGPQTIAVEQAVEVDHAFDIGAELGPQTVPVELAVEIDHAFDIGVALGPQTVPVELAIEVDEAFDIGVALGPQTVAVEQAVEVDHAFEIGVEQIASQVVPVEQAIEYDRAFDITPLMPELVSDGIAWPIAEAMAGCLCASWNDAPTRRPGRCCVLPGRDVAIDDCCAGQAWVRIVRVYQTTGDTFPDPNVSGQDTDRWPYSGLVNCDDQGLWAVLLAAGVARYVPVPDEDGEPPTCEALHAAAATEADDRGRVLKAITCCLPQKVNLTQLAVGEWIPAGPAGGCSGGEWQFTVLADPLVAFTTAGAGTENVPAMVRQRPPHYIDGDDDD